MSCYRDQGNNASFLGNAVQLNKQRLQQEIIKKVTKNSVQPTKSVNNTKNCISNAEQIKAQLVHDRENSTISDKQINSSLSNIKSRNENFAMNVDSNITRAMLENFTHPASSTITGNTRPINNKGESSGKIQIPLSKNTGKVNQEALQGPKCPNNLNETVTSHNRQPAFINDSEITTITQPSEINNTFQSNKISIMNDLKSIIISIEPQSCQNKMQSQDLMFLKNIKQRQKHSNSQVATPKYIKFKQYIQTNDFSQQLMAQGNHQNQKVPLKKHEQQFTNDNSKIDNSSSKSPLEQKKSHGLILNKVQMKTSSSKKKDANISGVQDSSWIFSNEQLEKIGNKSAEEDREEMSTTINQTSTINDASLFPDDQLHRQQQKKKKHCSPILQKTLNISTKHQQVMNNSQIHTSISVARANSQKYKAVNSGKKAIDIVDTSSPNNCTISSASQMNKGLQYGHHKQIISNNSGGKCMSNGSQPSRKQQRQRSGSDKQQHQKQQQRQEKIRNSTQKMTYISQDEINPSSTTANYSKKFLFNATASLAISSVIKKKGSNSNSVNHSQKQLKQSSIKSSRSNSIKKELFCANNLVKRERADSKKYLKHQIMKNNFIYKTENAAAYDGDISSVCYQQSKKKTTVNQSSGGTNANKNMNKLQNIMSASIEDQGNNQQHVGQDSKQPHQLDLQNQDPNQFHYYQTFSPNQPQMTSPNMQNFQEIEQMKRELLNKDLLIQNLKERLVNLEDKVNGIQREESRDKSQQRIKEAIMNLEKKLEQFHKEREENLQEIKMFGSMQSSSSRQSEVPQQNTGRYNPHHRSKQLQSQLEELESLITIADCDDFLQQKSIKTPMFEEDCVVDGGDVDLNIIGQDGDLLSDGQQDNSCLMMLEKEWQEQQRQNQGLLDQSKNNIVFFLNDDGETTFEDEEVSRLGTTSGPEVIVNAGLHLKEKFIKTQKIELSSKDKVAGSDMNFNENAVNINKRLSMKVKMADDLMSTGMMSDLFSTVKAAANPKKRNGSFSKTMSKTNLLNKIRTAMNKQGEIRKLMIEPKHIAHNTAVQTLCPQKKAPKRFIVKRSQERNQQQQLLAAVQPLISKEKITMIAQQQQKQTVGTVERQQEMLKQKEKVAISQKEALMKERELSLKLRQAIQKINFKGQMTGKQPKQQQQI